MATNSGGFGTVRPIAPDLDEVDTDLLVVGSGFAGLWAAITAVDHGVERVTLVDKADIARSSQSRLSAGATIYRLADDDLDTWVGDVAEAQQYLCHQDMVTDMLATSASRLAQLEQWGLTYATTGDGSYLRLPSRGFDHLQMLVLPTYRTRVGGRAVTTVLREQVVRRRCRLLPRLFVTDLLQADGRVCGVTAIDRESARPYVIRARSVILAAGDCSFRGHYACTDAATGDAFALALRAGARLANMEFLCSNTGPPTFGFEGTGIATRFGGTFRDSDGQAFMARYHPDADAAEVSHVVGAMAAESSLGRGPFTLDLRAAADADSFLRTAFARMGGFMPTNLDRLAQAGVDVFQDPQEWAPAVQTLRGGARTDIDGATDLPGLFAAGMAQAFDPGLFNGWSSMRAMWSGQRAGRAAAALLESGGGAPTPDPSERRNTRSDTRERCRRALAPLHTGDDPAGGATWTANQVLAALHEALFARDVCLVKEQHAMATSLDAIRALADDATRRLHAADPHELVKVHETHNMLAVAQLFLTASLARTESRGDHQRADHPTTDNDRWLRWLNLSSTDTGRPHLGAVAPLPALVLDVAEEPVPLDDYPNRPDPRR